MASLESLKKALRQEAYENESLLKLPLSDAQYSAGFKLLLQGPGWLSYQDFAIAQLSHLLAPLLASRISISVLEIGPGPKSVLEYLPEHLRWKITNYTAFEPNQLFASSLENRVGSASDGKSPYPCLGSSPTIHRAPFVLKDISKTRERYDIVLFCHSMYGLKPARSFIEQALDMLTENRGSMVVVIHREGVLNLDDLVCHRISSCATGMVSIPNQSASLDSFASFIAGFTLPDTDAVRGTGMKWREICRALGRCEETHPHHLIFNSPETMMAFTKLSSKLPDLTTQVPLAMQGRPIKNRGARVHRPASIIRPTKIEHLQHSVRWALENGLGLTVLGGGHSGHCVRPGVVAVDMSAFNQIYVIPPGEDGSDSGSHSDSLVVIEAGCTSGDVVSKTMAAGLMVPLGSRPSVGAGLWLQGGIGHLTRAHGLTCDSIVGAVLVSVGSGEIFLIGSVPEKCRPPGAARSENEEDLLWALKGAGSNVGIVISVTFRTFAAPTLSVRNWVFTQDDHVAARLRLRDFNNIATKLPRNASADAYLYWEDDCLKLGVTMFETSQSSTSYDTVDFPLIETETREAFGTEDSVKIVDSDGLFESDMYMSGYAAGKTSSFKRCVFLKDIGAVQVAGNLLEAIASRPSSLCYLHLLQGGGKITDVESDATAFGCRHWDFACVVTGVWSRDLDGTEAAFAAVRWVYNVVEKMLPLSEGVYGADLGPDLRDAALVAHAFGANLLRLARLKLQFDPHNVLAYSCQLPRISNKQKLIILVTVVAKVVSISDAVKREYAMFSGADVNSLHRSRAYKENHREALSAFFQDQLRQKPWLPKQHFLDLVHCADDVDVDVLLITGMRDEAPVATLSHLVPDHRMIEVYISTGEEVRRTRRGGFAYSVEDKEIDRVGSAAGDLLHCRTFVCDNNKTGTEAITTFHEQKLSTYLHGDLQRLASMVAPIPNFPQADITFQHVLGIAQYPGGLVLCTSLLQTHLPKKAGKLGSIVCCEAGGFVFASALAAGIDVPLILVREAGKLPPPTISVAKVPSYISSLASPVVQEARIEIQKDVLPKNGSVLVVDDVLSTGKTLCAVLKLLRNAGVSMDDVSVVVVAEFSVHRGRDLLRQRGFGKVDVRSLLVYGGR